MANGQQPQSTFSFNNPQTGFKVSSPSLIQIAKAIREADPQEEDKLGEIPTLTPRGGSTFQAPPNTARQVQPGITRQGQAVQQPQQQQPVQRQQPETDPRQVEIQEILAERGKIKTDFQEKQPEIDRLIKKRQEFAGRFKRIGKNSEPARMIRNISTKIDSLIQPFLKRRKQLQQRVDNLSKVFPEKKQVERKTTKDIAGRQRFDDTGKLLFPDATKPESSDKEKAEKLRIQAQTKKLEAETEQIKKKKPALTIEEKETKKLEAREEFKEKLKKEKDKARTGGATNKFTVRLLTKRTTSKDEKSLKGKAKELGITRKELVEEMLRQRGFSDVAIQSFTEKITVFDPQIKR